MNTFGDRLRELRKQRNMTIREATRKMNLGSVTTLSNYERNERQPDLATLVRLATYYNVSLDYLIAGKKQEMYLKEIKEMLNELREGS